MDEKINLERKLKKLYDKSCAVKLSSVQDFTENLEAINLAKFRNKYITVKIVEMDLPANIQALKTLYYVYWEKRTFLDFDTYYKFYSETHSSEIEIFRVKIGMCTDCFYKGLPARIYRTWASLITQIHAAYVAENVFGKGTVAMSEELDRKNCDIKITFNGYNSFIQIKKETKSREVRVSKSDKIAFSGDWYYFHYKVPQAEVFENKYTLKGLLRKPYTDFIANTTLSRLENGFIVFTEDAFIGIKEKCSKK